MLYLLNVDLDYAGMGERRQALIEAEHTRVAELVREGVVVCEWRKASGRGVYALWNCRSHGHLQQIIAGLPLAPYLRELEIIPLVEHPLFPGGRPVPSPAVA